MPKREKELLIDTVTEISKVNSKNIFLMTPIQLSSIRRAMDFLEISTSNFQDQIGTFVSSSIYRSQSAYKHSLQTANLAQDTIRAKRLEGDQKLESILEIGPYCEKFFLGDMTDVDLSLFNSLKFKRESLRLSTQFYDAIFRRIDPSLGFELSDNESGRFQLQKNNGKWIGNDCSFQMRFFPYEESIKLSDFNLPEYHSSRELLFFSPIGYIFLDEIFEDDFIRIDVMREAYKGKFDTSYNFVLPYVYFLNNELHLVLFHKDLSLFNQNFDLLALAQSLHILEDWERTKIVLYKDESGKINTRNEEVSLNDLAFVKNPNFVRAGRSPYSFFEFDMFDEVSVNYYGYEDQHEESVKTLAEITQININHHDYYPEFDPDTEPWVWTKMIKEKDPSLNKDITGAGDKNTGNDLISFLEGLSQEELVYLRRLIDFKLK